MIGREAQIALAEKLQGLLLNEYVRRLEAGSISDTGMGNLQKLLLENGWSLDPQKLPQGLRDKLTSNMNPTELTDDDPDVIALFQKMA